MCRTMNDQRKQVVNAIQTVVILIAVPLGVIPLVQAVFDFDQGGIFRFVFSDPTGNTRWVIPSIVVVVAAVIVIADEELPKRGGS